MKRLLLCLMVLCLLTPSALAVDVFGLEVDEQTAVLDLDAAHIAVTDAQTLAAAIDRMPALQEVLLFDSALPRADMEWLFDTYPHIFFGFTIRIATHTIRTDDTAFSTLHRSVITDKKDHEHSTKELSVLRMCTRLKALDLGHNALTDLSFLSGLTELRVLILGPNYYVTDVSPLASLTELEYLELFSTDASDVSALAGMMKLRDLNLACSDHLRDLSPLHDLPALERFWGGRGKISAEQQKAMEEAHPGCLFDWENNPTAGTWREHPRYDVIYRMFHGTEYIPFD